jgi:hypothetical protein
VLAGIGLYRRLFDLGALLGGKDQQAGVRAPPELRDVARGGTGAAGAPSTRCQVRARASNGSTLRRTFRRA